MMNRTIAVVAALSFGIAGCASYPYGALYDGTTTPHTMMRVNGDGANKGGTKEGESCSTGILSPI